MANADRLTIMRRWTVRGAFFGAAVAALDLTGWRGPTYLPLEAPDAVFYNGGRVLGMVVGGAFLGLIAAFVRSLFLRR